MRYLITKFFEPEGDYRRSLVEISGEEENLTPSLDVIIKVREMTAEEAREVATRDHIASVTEDKTRYIPEPIVEDVHVETTTTDLDQEALWYHQLLKANDAGYRGKGATVAVLDTGVRDDIASDVFGPRLKATRSFVDGESVTDGNGHGTFCSVAATPDESQLLVGKVLSDEGSGYDSWIISAIDWAVSNGANVISMSLGADDTDSSSYDPVLKAAKDKGVMVFAAAGNSGNDHPVNVPGRSEYAYAIAAMDDKTNHVVYFSCTGPEVDFAGVGYNVYFEGKNWSGTSMATPICACVYATVLAQAKDPTIAMKALVSTCYNLTDPPNFDGVGVPQAMSAISALTYTIPPVEPLPKYSYLSVPKIKEKAKLISGKKTYGTFIPEGM